MIRIDVSGIDEVQAALRTAADQVPFALAKALTDTAWKVRTAEQSEIARVFDRPTQWIKQQVFVTQATKKNLTAIVGPPPNGDWARPSNIIRANTYGGLRRARGVEKKLVSLGWMPAGWVAVPAPSMRVDQYGNIAQAIWRMLINETAHGARGNYFVVKYGNQRTRHLAPGIYMRMDRSRLSPQVLFVSRSIYKRKLEWPEVARQVVGREFGPLFSAAFRHALATKH